MLYMHHIRKEMIIFAAVKRVNACRWVCALRESGEEPELYLQL